MATLKHKLREAFAVYYSNYFMTASSKFSVPIALLGSLATFVAVYFGKQFVVIGVIGLLALVFVVYTSFGKFYYGKRGIRQYETKKYWESDFGIKPNVGQYEAMLKIKEGLNQINEKLGLPKIEFSEEWYDTYTWLKHINKENKFDEIVKEDLKKWGLK